MTKILIVGAGISGLALAIGLSQAGIECEIIEKQPDLQVAGVGIILQSNTLRALDGLGVLNEVVEQGFGYNENHVLDANGQPVATRSIVKITAASFPATVGIPRTTLARLTFAKAERLGVSVRFSTTLASIGPERPDSIGATFSDGRSGDYALIVGADGLHSSVRALAFAGEPGPRYTGQGVWRYLTRRHKLITTGARILGPRLPIGFIPLTTDLMYLFTIENAPVAEYRAEADLVRLMREQLEGYGPFVDEIVAGITSPEGINYRPLEAFIMPRPWHRGRALLIGDAVHAMTPHMASGSGMAIEDALVLSEILAAGTPVPEALTKFEERRFRRCEAVVTASVTIGAMQVANRPHDDYERVVASTRTLLAQMA